MTLVDLKHPEQAIEAYDKALALQRDLALAWQNKGSALLMLGRNRDALDAFEQAIDCKTEYLEAAWINKGSALRLLKRYGESLEAFNEALKVNPNSARAWYSLGAVLHKVGRAKAADDAFAQARRLGFDV
jgi:tetratricopeptide (TPR) repeat protein